MAADHGIAVTWGDEKPGREKMALDLWGEAVGWSDKLVSDARVERWDAVSFEATGGYPQGAVRYYGTTEQVEALVGSEDFQNILARGQIILNGFGFRRFVTGQAMYDGVLRFVPLVEAL